MPQRERERLNWVPTFYSQRLHLWSLFGVFFLLHLPQYDKMSLTLIRCVDYKLNATVVGFKYARDYSIVIVDFGEKTGGIRFLP